jgi:hypothetical protein
MRELFALLPKLNFRLFARGNVGGSAENLLGRAVRFQDGSFDGLEHTHPTLRVGYTLLRTDKAQKAQNFD